MWNLIQAFLPLLVIIGILYFTLRYIKNSGFNIKGQRVKKYKIKVLSGQMIMPKKFVSIVQIEDKILVLGVGESVTLLKELDSSYLPVEDDVEIVKAGNDSFFSVLKKNIGLR